MNWLKYVKLDKELPDPQYSTDGAFGIDLFASEECCIPPGLSSVVNLGVCVEIPKGHVGFLKSRSGHGFNKKVESHFGWIDEDYRGELKIMLYNHSAISAMQINKGTKIAQLGIIEKPHIILREVKELSQTLRGEGGFGSTGN